VYSLNTGRPYPWEVSTLCTYLLTRCLVPNHRIKAYDCRVRTLSWSLVPCVPVLCLQGYVPCYSYLPLPGARPRGPIDQGFVLHSTTLRPSWSKGTFGSSHKIERNHLEWLCWHRQWL
jgi:hypothetical protein